MEIRPADVADAARIAEIHVRSWQQAYQGLIPQDYLDSLDPADRIERRAQLLSSLDPERSACLVVTGDDAEIAGFAHLGPSRDDDDDPAETGEIMAIYLAPDAWGHGFGRELMAASLGFLTGAGYQEATLWVLDTNDRARRFYAAAGFAADGAAKIGSAGEHPLHEVRYRLSLP